MGIKLFSMLMKLQFKKWETVVAGSMDDVWTFFSNPANLQKITPEDMNFKVLSDIAGIQMYPGMLIRYLVSPLAGIPMKWVTEITAFEERRYFIDEQRSGPYAFWHHEHRFAPVDEGIMMTDLLHYALPFGIFGRMVNKFMVARRIDHIFEYRQKIIHELFPPVKAAIEMQTSR
jgi:ligand-binding SRPBCC domain-containing protein